MTNQFSAAGLLYGELQWRLGDGDLSMLIGTDKQAGTVVQFTWKIKVGKSTKKIAFEIPVAAVWTTVATAESLCYRMNTELQRQKNESTP